MTECVEDFKDKLVYIKNVAVENDNVVYTTDIESVFDNISEQDMTQIITYLENIGVEIKREVKSEEEDFDASEVDEEVFSEEDYQKMVKELKVDDSTKLYLWEIGRIPLLTAEEELELGERIANGDDDAKKKLTEANLRLVVSIANRFKDSGLQYLDLVQEGNLGLMRAVEKYDYTKNYRFSTYATWWIKQSMQRAIMNYAKTIRIPAHMADSIRKMNVAIKAFVQKNGREPKPEELAEILQVPIKKVNEMMSLTRDTVSFESPVGEEGDSCLGDYIRDENAEYPENSIIVASLRDNISKVLHTLTDKEQEVLTLRFGLNDGKTRTLEEVGKIFGVTRERIRQIEVKALNKMRHPSRRKYLEDFTN